MNSYKYVVFLDEIKIAEFKELEYAVVMIKGIFDEYYNEPKISVRIERKIDEVKE